MSISSQEVAAGVWRDSRLLVFLTSFKWRGSDDAMALDCEGVWLVNSDEFVTVTSVSSSFCICRNAYNNSNNYY